MKGIESRPDSLPFILFKVSNMRELKVKIQTEDGNIHEVNIETALDFLMANPGSELYFDELKEEE